jgi:acyl carrier protein
MAVDVNDLLAKCADLLGVEELGAEDDFFGVGGNSLDAVELSEMLSTELGRDVGMQEIMQSPSFGELLRAVNTGS